MITESATATAAPHERLLHELALEREQIRRSAVLNVLTAVGLALGLVAAWLGGPAGAASGWLESYLGVGGAAAWVSAAGYLLAFLCGGLPAGARAFEALARERKLHIDLLMVVAAVAAALVGEPRDGAILLLLFGVAGTLEEHAFSTTKRAVVDLMKLRPETATLLEDGVQRSVAAANVGVGAVVLVRPGERVPLDGVLLEGTSSLDQSPLTGESVPVDKAPGDQLLAGSVNGYGALRMRVTKPASETAIARMIELVTEAQAGRSPSQRFGDWFGERYTVLVLVGTAVALGIFLLTGMDVQPALYKAATLLVVASPCAIVISVPAAVLAALARAARMGVLFKGGAALEDLGAARVVAFDKTGTLTHGRMRVTEVVPFGTSAADALALAAAIEAGSEHPVAKAIVAAAGEAGGAGALAGPEAAALAGPGRAALAELGSAGKFAADLTSLPGMGVRANVAGVPHWAGNRRLAAADGVELGQEVTATLARLEAKGHTAVMVGNATGVVGVIAVADTVRPEAAAAIAGLRERGVKRVAMLTGDHPEAALSVAAELGLAPQDVYAGLLPEQKVAIVHELARESKVVFVGDGINDAAALASSTVGVAMGVAGSGAALEAADVALLSDDLAKLPDALDLARRTNTVIRQNLVFALGIMLVMVVITLVARLPLPLGVLGHEGGTVLVVLNGLRLLRQGRPSAQNGPGGRALRQPPPTTGALDAA